MHSAWASLCSIGDTSLLVTTPIYPVSCVIIELVKLIGTRQTAFPLNEQEWESTIDPQATNDAVAVGRSEMGLQREGKTGWIPGNERGNQQTVNQARHERQLILQRLSRETTETPVLVILQITAEKKNSTNLLTCMPSEPKRKPRSPRTPYDRKSEVSTVQGAAPRFDGRGFGAEVTRLLGLHPLSKSFSTQLKDAKLVRDYGVMRKA
ncbi:hypothetical protein K438DRAFT_1750391 [Mycena galopus ATCC 62051]|nr:hypothetical protein K438DRAFT_1750391 [Mycena galopus ATCC 62051]